MNWLRNLPIDHQNAIKEHYTNSRGKTIIIADPCYVEPIRTCLKLYYNITVFSTGDICENTRKWINEFKTS